MNEDDILSLPRLVSSMKRELKLIIICMACFVGVAILYSLLASSKYTAHTSILIDPAQSDAVAEIASKAKSRFDSAAIVSQIELIKSRRVAQKALEYLSGNKGHESKEVDFVANEELLADIIRGLRVFREGESYVLTIHYTATDPKISADRANAFAQAYIHDQINSFSEDSLKTSKWLKNKIETLRNQSVSANLDVQNFRKKNNLIQSGGRSVNEQQLSNMNEKLGDAKANVATAHVKYRHSQKIVRQKNITAAVAEAFDSDVINNVRAQHLEDQQKLLELTRTLGNSHQVVKKLRKKISESRNVIFSEMKRISESYKSEYEIALAQETSLKESLDKLVGVQFNNDGQSFELDALEKEAEAYANLHDEYLKKYETMQQQQSFPVSGSRIITKAVQPLKRSYPKPLVMVGLALILGTGFGIFLALLKDSFDASFKRAGQIENRTGMHFLGFFPSFSGQNIGSPKASDFLDSEYSQSVDAPLSVQAETCRNISVTAGRKLKEGCRVIGVTSDNPHQGKSVMAANLALYMAQSGSKCLLIDADLRNPVLSKENFTRVGQGLHSVLMRSVDIKSALIQDSKTNLFVLPSEGQKGAEASHLVSSTNMKELVDSAKENFDFIIVDLPPLSVTADASFSSVFVDSFLLSLEWGKSKPNSLEFNLKVNEIPKDKILGVVLGQTDMQKMAKNYGHTVHSLYTKS